MSILKKIFGGINLTWRKVIISSIIAGIYTACMLILPIAKDTSFSDIGVSFEVWILLGLIIIMNSNSAKDSALKCFVFFLISQPLIYLIQVPFNAYGWGIFSYYRYWFIWTIATLPMGYIGWYIKKGKWWGLLILTPILVLLGFHFNRYLGMAILSFPNHILTTIFCAVTMIIYPISLFEDKKIKLAGVAIGILILLILAVFALQKPTNYETDIMISGGSLEVTFDDTYRIYFEDESMGQVYITYVDQGLNDWVAHAIFKKTGKTDVTLESPSGEKTVFSINVKRDNYTINKK